MRERIDGWMNAVGLPPNRPGGAMWCQAVDGGGVTIFFVCSPSVGRGGERAAGARRMRRAGS